MSEHDVVYSAFHLNERRGACVCVCVSSAWTFVCQSHGGGHSRKLGGVALHAVAHKERRQILEFVA